MNLAIGRVLDYGCGFGFDVDYYDWESYDPYYRPQKPEGDFDTTVCLSVLNTLTRNNRIEVINNMLGYLKTNGNIYITVPRDLPELF